jgi:para-nitrobenzyl esterase
VTRVAAAALALSGAAALPATVQAQAGAAMVTTDRGRLAGVAQGDVTAWLGIPFAAPPVGDLRWRPPAAAAPWSGVQQATRFAPSCMQPLRDHGIAYYVGDDPVAEDCLYLNVWAPAARAPRGGWPVIVYIHGGSFVAGSGRKPLYVGDRLAAKGAVVVSVNYRLGVLGFMAHPALSAESADRASGNYGLMDQIAALRWVRANIAAFGGDPARVTAMGQSAGAMSIAALQVAPAARGLFQRIAAFSGSPYTAVDADRVPSLAAAEARGVAFQRSVGAADLAALRRLPADRLVAAQPPAMPPIVDGHVLPGAPAQLYARGAAADVPLLLGTVRDEALGVPPVASVADFRAAVERLYGARAPAVLALYPVTTDAGAATQANRLWHDLGFATMMRSWARMQVAHGTAPVWGYSFERKHPYAAGVRFSDLDPVTTGVNHTDDVPYWLGTYDSLNATRRTRAWTAQDRTLGDGMQAALVAFARSGDPNTPALGTRWPRYATGDGRAVRFADGAVAGAWPNAARLDRLAAMGAPRP